MAERKCRFIPCGRPVRAKRKGLCQSHARQEREGLTLTKIGPKGFAAIAETDRAHFLEMCAYAGRRAHERGKAHVFKPGHEASEAGRAGGFASGKVRRKKAENVSGED